MSHNMWCTAQKTAANEVKIRFHLFPDLPEVTEAVCAACSESGGKYSDDSRKDLKAALSIKRQNPAYRRN